MVNKYYQKHKEKLRKKKHTKNLPEEEKDKKQKKVRDRYKNLPKEKKTTWVYEKILFNT